jgi:hypothetical protein
MQAAGMDQRNPTARRAANTTTDVPALSAKLASAALSLVDVVYALTDRTIDARDSWLIWPQVEQLETVVELLKSVVLEADAHGQYQPGGRPALRLASDDCAQAGDSSTIGGMRRAA